MILSTSISIWFLFVLLTVTFLINVHLILILGLHKLLLLCKIIDFWFIYYIIYIKIIEFEAEPQISGYLFDFDIGRSRIIADISCEYKRKLIEFAFKTAGMIICFGRCKTTNIYSSVMSSYWTF